MKLITYMPQSGKYIVACVLVIGIFSMPGCKQATEQMTSPDGSIRAEISVNTSQELMYNLSFHGKTIIPPSFMGIVINADTLGKNVSLKLTEKQIVDEEYTTQGVHSVAHDNAVEYTWEIHSQKIDWKLQTRLYNDGLAFRYLIPNKGITLVNKELTSFSVHKNIPVWFFERPNDWKLKSYAGEWLQTMSDSLYRVSPTGPVQGPVLVYELPENKYMAITEAALYNYSGMRLEAKDDASLQVNFTEKKGFGIEDDITTPWRVILLADDLNELVNSDIISNLNPAPDTTMFHDQSWIKPGKAAWYWWTGARASFDEEMKTVDNAPGKVDEQLISLIDVTANSLAAAKIEVPKYMQGNVFLGKNANPRQYVFGFRQRSGDAVEDKKEESRKMEVYAAQVDCLDQNIGRLVQGLKDQGVYENTVIFFLSDNGACAEEVNKSKGVQIGGADSFVSYGKNWANVSNTPYRLFKHFNHEGGILTPMIISWPNGISKTGVITDQPALINDIMPTCLELAGAKYPIKYNGNTIFPVDGESFWPLVSGDKKVKERRLFFQHEGNGAIREDNWKLVKQNKKEWELYEIQKDPTELNDVSTKDTLKRKILEDEYTKWSMDNGVLPWPLKQKN